MDVIGRAGRLRSPSIEACLAELDPSAPADFRELASLLACEWATERPRRVGLAGGQGAGKSTLARLIESACRTLGLHACVLSLDDFYLTKEERRALADRVHPLLETRGPPGTHDTARCQAALRALSGVGSGAAVEIPVFDKGIDDRVGTRWLRGPFDLVVLEGWCVGARSVAEAALAHPLNRLERERDPDGRWRGFVNERLATEYAAIWDDLDLRVLLRVPGLEAVRRWRLEQESARPRSLRWGAREVDRFVEYFERITRSMLDPSFGGAEWVVTLDERHRIRDLRSFAAGGAQASQPPAGGR